MKMKSVLAAVVALGLTSLAVPAVPAVADPIDISADMTIDNSTFKSGELNSESVAITFPLVTNIVGDLLYVDLPVGYVLGASAGVVGVQSYDPVTGICGGFDTGITVPALSGGPFTCLSTPDFPFEFLIGGNVPSNEYVINFAPGSFRAKTTTVDETGEITITLAISGDPLVTDDFGHVTVTTVAPVLANTGLDVLSTAAVGALTGLAGLLAIVFVAVRRRTRG